MNKTIAIHTIIALAIASGSFYAGMRYQQIRFSNMMRSTGIADRSPDERSARVRQFGNANGTRTIRMNGGLVAGEIIAQDEQSITVKLRDGGSKIIILSGDTEVMETVDGSAADLAVGQTVTVTGSANSDGSVTAQAIQIRPIPQTDRSGQ